MYALLAYAVHQLRSLPQRLSPSQAWIVVSQHVRGTQFLPKASGLRLPLLHLQ